MSDKRRRRFPVGDPRASAEQYHQDMFQRRQTQSVSIRKQRKEYRLWRRRQPQSASDKTITVEELFIKLDSFLSSPHDAEKLKELQTSMAIDTASTNQFLKDLIDITESEAKNRLWVASLRKILQDNNGMLDVCEAALAILTDLTSFSSIALKASADDYYGMTSLRWSDLIQEDSLLIDLLLVWMREPSTSAQILEHVCSILGNLLQDSARPIPLVLPAWATIVQRLPVSNYLCATLVRQDSTHYGTSFLHDLTPEIMANLLMESTTAVEASWMLEALSRKEAEAIRNLCESLVLVSAIVTTLEESAASSNALVLVPLLRATCNFINGGLSAHTLLSHASFIPTVSKILEQGVVIESLEVASAMLAWNRAFANEDIGIIPAFFPVLVRIIASPEASLPWKRDAAWAVCCSFDDEQSEEYRSNSRVKNVAAIWLSAKLSVAQSDFIRSLTDLLSNPDKEAVASAVQILDLLLRTAQPIRQLFENAGGVERLERICEKGGEGGFSDFAANLAADLLDDFFEADDDEDDHCIAPSRGENEFVFGIIEPPAAFNFGTSDKPGPGRGRGLTIPAWMQQPR